MNTTSKTLARLIPLVALLALSPLSCTDAGDEPTGATGPATQYNPEMDWTGASIAVDPATKTLSAGDTFTIVATLSDGDGVPISGAPLELASEAASYLTTPVNPSITNDSGKASFVVTVTPDCPAGSYAIGVYSQGAYPLNGPNTIGYCRIRVN